MVANETRTMFSLDQSKTTGLEDGPRMREGWGVEHHLKTLPSTLFVLFLATFQNRQDLG